ncbi:ABC transporter permease [Paenibacillus gansuensis]|uniref:ABC transporter permease n=1 Tax=Paenibacillus gansuensis TaxID=306542 RepID=A0ABW5PDT6_9BACL
MLWKRLKEQKQLHFVMIPMAIWAIVIYYVPMMGNIIAFQDYTISKGFLDSPWVGLKHFESFFSNNFTPMIIRNTLAMSILGLIFGTVTAVIFAILLNEIYNKYVKNFIQTVSYLPYFISMAVAATLFTQLLSRTGAVNEGLISLGIIEEGIPFMEQSNLFWIIITIQGVWKTIGWNAIIYLAAIVGIPQETYEASYVDGAGRFRRMWHITLPAISPTIAILLILNSGYLLQGGFEQQLLMFNPLVMDYAEVINTYVYKRGLHAGEYSYATAVGMFQSVVSIALIIFVNKITKRIVGQGLW